MVNAHSKQNNAMWTEKIIQFTPANLNLLDKGSVIRSSKQISKKMRRECKYYAHFTGMDTEFELQ